LLPCSRAARHANSTVRAVPPPTPPPAREIEREDWRVGEWGDGEGWRENERWGVDGGGKRGGSCKEEIRVE